MENGGKNHTTIGSNYIFLNRIGLRRIQYYIYHIYYYLLLNLLFYLYFEMASVDRVKSKMEGQKWQIML